MSTLWQMKPPVIRIVGPLGLPFRKPLNNTPTCHLFVDGCGLSQFNESDCRSWIECFPAIVAATLVAQRPFLYLSCGSVDEARHLRTQLSRPDLLNHITRDHGRSIVECIKRVDFAVQCRWLDVIPPKPDSFVSSTSLLIPSSPEYLCPVDGLHVVDVGNVICLEELRLQFNKLKWKKALRKSEFVLGASVDVADETCTIGILHSDLNERLPSTLLFQVGEIWKQIKSLHHKCNEPIRPTQASIYQCVPKQKPYLYRESREMFEDLITFFSLDHSICVWLYHAEGNQSFSISLQPGHLLTLSGESRFKWLFSLIRTSSPTSNSKQSYAVVFRRLREECRDAFLNKATDRVLIGGIRRIVKEAPSDKSCPPVLKQILENYNEQLSKSKFEDDYVHKIYDRISCHFSHTRYRPWPKVKLFLEMLPSGSIVLDSGCGNGKYSQCNPNIVWIGSDRSSPLLHCALARKSPFEKHRDSPEVLGNAIEIGNSPIDLYSPIDSYSVIDSCSPTVPIKAEVFVSDCMKMNMRSNCVDACISIAVIHHLSTEQKRLQGIQELLRCLRPGGRLLLYVWAMEQQEGIVGSRQFDTQDVFVPWHLQKHLDSNAKLSRPKQNEEMELSQLESTISRQHEEMPENPKLVKLYRYYHVFRRDEISDLCSRALNSQILDVSFDANNWVILMEKLS